MGRMVKIGNMTIRVNGNDHLTAHFHVITPDHEGLVAIKTLALFRGALPAQVLVSALQWAKVNHDALIAEWNAWNPRHPV